MLINEILGPVMRAVTPAVKTASSSVRTLGQMTSLAIKLGLPAAVAGNIAEVVYEYASARYPDQVRKERAYNLMITKIVVILTATFAGMGAAQFVTFYGTLGLSAMSKSIGQLAPILGGTIGAELSAHSDIVNNTVKVLVYTLHPEAAYLDTKDAAAGWLESMSQKLKDLFGKKASPNTK